MAAVAQRRIAEEEEGQRLDRWFKHHYPGLGHGRLEKLLRTGQIRVDGRRVKAGQRLETGQTIRVPPLDEAAERPARTQRRPAVSPEDAAMLRDRVLYRDDWIIALDKPAGLAVQGGEKTARHIDGMLDALRFGAAERPRLVHRLDRDTSGVLVLARNARAAREIAAGFRGKDVTKLYWAAVVGVPREARGIVDLALAKRAGAARAGGEAMVADAEGGQRAVTAYRVVDQTGNRAAWLALWPRTGRTHQLRVHCAAIGTPILGDGKYGGADAHLGGEGISDRLHLHARRLVMPHPGGSGVFDVTAPLPEHMRQTWKALGFDPKQRAADDIDNPWSEDPRRGRRRNE